MTGQSKLRLDFNYYVLRISTLNNSISVLPYILCFFLSFLFCDCLEKHTFLGGWLHWVFCCAQAFSGCGERGLHFVAVCGLLIAVACLVAEHRL